MLSCIDSTTTDTSEVSEHNHNCGDNLRRALEQFITTQEVISTPFEHIVATLARVCYGRADHIRKTSTDELLAQAWDFNAKQCQRVLRAAMPAEPTIKRRSAKLGVPVEDIERYVSTLPEPLQGIARDYFHGALPHPGRSTALQAMVLDLVERIKSRELVETALEQRR
jgi:hypothetical protein